MLCWIQWSRDRGAGLCSRCRNRYRRCLAVWQCQLFFAQIAAQISNSTATPAFEWWPQELQHVSTWIVSILHMFLKPRTQCLKIIWRHFVRFSNICRSVHNFKLNTHLTLFSQEHRPGAGPYGFQWGRRGRNHVLQSGLPFRKAEWFGLRYEKGQYRK